MIVGLIWIPLSRSQVGLSLYAIGSNKLAAFRSGVPVNRTKVIAYMFGGLVAAFAGLSLVASTGIGSPLPEPTYVLISIAAVVLGGVSLAGGIGGVFGPMVGVVVLQLIRDDMTFMRVDPNYGPGRPGIDPDRCPDGRQPRPDEKESGMTAASGTMNSKPGLRSAGWRNVLRDYPLVVLTILLVGLVLVVQLARPGTVNPSWAAFQVRQAAILAILAGSQTICTSRAASIYRSVTSRPCRASSPRPSLTNRVAGSSAWRSPSAPRRWWAWSTASGSASFACTR